MLVRRHNDRIPSYPLTMPLLIGRHVKNDLALKTVRSIDKNLRKVGGPAGNAATPIRLGSLYFERGFHGNGHQYLLKRNSWNHRMGTFGNRLIVDFGGPRNLDQRCLHGSIFSTLQGEL